jgi:predicted DNA-binding transcriptional regulator AlpA
MLKAEFDRIYSEYRQTKRQRGGGNATAWIASAYDGWLAVKIEAMYQAKSQTDTLAKPKSK